MPRRSVPPSMPSVVRALSRVRGPIVLAVSGGLDSMALFHIATQRRSIRERCCVATFNHGTGPHSGRAVRLVRATARRFGVPVVSGRAPRAGSSEGEWREMRWRFLNAVATRRRATIVTAHTRDDQIETVVMRILRGASPRGLAALYADSPIVRPLLGISRRALERYTRAVCLRFEQDPTNDNRRYLRNAVRLDLLPAIRLVQPTFERDVLSLARRAAKLRRQTESVALAISREQGKDRLEVDVTAFRGLSTESIALLWPALTARLGVPLDRRGVRRASEFTLTAQVGQRAQCSGGLHLERARRTIVLSRPRMRPPVAVVQLGHRVEFGRWRLRTVSRRTFLARQPAQRLWAAAIDATLQCSVRVWKPGDRVTFAGPTGARRLTRYFYEHSIPAGERRGWPVVVANNQVVWVPGVWQSEAGSPSEPLGSATTYLVCERNGG